MSKAAKRGFKERLAQQARLQAKLADKDAKPGNRALRRSGAHEQTNEHREPAHHR